MAEVAFVLLAAGAGARFGGIKQIAQVQGEALVVRAARTALDAARETLQAARVLVILGAHADEVLAALDALSATERARLEIVHNPDWSSGQASSVRTAIHALAADRSIAAVVFLPVDQPFLSAHLLRNLVAAWRAGASIAAPQVDGQLRGAPALFDKRHFSELRALSGDVGGRELLRRHADAVVPVETSAQLLIDIDTPAEYRTTLHSTPPESGIEPLG